MFWRDGQPYRQIDGTFATEWDAFEASALKHRLFEQRRLIRHEPVDLDLAPMPGAHAVIRPEPIEFLSYPYEWTFGELREAALLTLDIQLDAMAAGWTLKDASAYNIQFHDARPIHIDSASFERLEDGSPWIAYRQFCEQFLAPLVLAARRDIRLTRPPAARPGRDPARSGERDAAEADMARLRAPLPCASCMPVRRRRHSSNDDDGRAARQTRLARPRLEGLIRNLRSTVAKLDWHPRGTEWADYAEHTSYAERAAADKDRLVDAWLREVPGAQVWDLGANTGRFSRIAADAGKRVVAFDIDPAAAERHFRCDP